MIHSRVSWFLFVCSFVFATCLELVVLPDKVIFLRPEWLVILLIYWLLRHPEKIGIVIAALIGLIMDVMSGIYFGIHVISMSLVCYLVLTMHQRLKMFPVAQQSAVIFFIVGIQLMVVHTLQTTLGGTSSGLSYLWQALSSALIWPILTIILDRVLHSFR